MRKIFGPKGDKATGEWRTLPNEELNDLYSSPTIFWMIRSRRMRWVGYVAPMGEGRGVDSLVGNLRERDHLEDPGIAGRITLRWIFRKWDVRAWTGSIWLTTGTGGGHLRMRS